MTEHSPGPWRHKHLNFCKVVSANDGERAIAMVMAGVNAEARSQCRANARLIVAAPELLHALKTFLGETDDSDYMTLEAIHRMGREAIAKATGEPS